MAGSIYRTTAQTFECLRFTLEQDALTVREKMWVRKLYAFASKNHALTRTQLDVLDEICYKADIGIVFTFLDVDFEAKFSGTDEHGKKILSTLEYEKLRRIYG